MNAPRNEQEGSTTFDDTEYDVPDDFDTDYDFEKDIDDDMFAEMLNDYQDDTDAHDMDMNSDDSDFIDDMNNDVEKLKREAKEYVASGVNANTQKKINAAVSRFEKFVSERGEKTNILELDVEHLDALLAVFLKGAKREDGNEYEPVSVQSFSACIRKYLSDKITGIDAEKSFPVAKSALARKKKELKSLGKGNRPNRADCLTDRDEETLWERGVLGDSSPTVLRNTLWFLTTKLLGFRGRHESKQLLWTDLKLEKSSRGDYLEFNERLTKTRDGKNGEARKFPPKMFANRVQPERCPIRLYKKYLEHRPPTENAKQFLLNVNTHPRAKTWYIDVNMGVNKIAKIMSQMAESAGLTGRFTNHSVRRTMCSQLLNSGRFDACTIAQLSGHKDPNSLKHYVCADEDTQRAMCDVLQNPQLYKAVQQPSRAAVHEKTAATAATAVGYTDEEKENEAEVQGRGPILGLQAPKMVPNTEVQTQSPALHVARIPTSAAKKITEQHDQMPVATVNESNHNISTSNQLITSSQAVLRGAMAGASFHGPVTINFNLNQQK